MLDGAEMKFTEEPKYGRTQFRYGIEDIEIIIGFLMSNNENVVRAFHAMWSFEAYADLPRESAPCLLRLINEVKEALPYVGCDQEKVWGHICRNKGL
jgi:hypothetical protein